MEKEYFKPSLEVITIENSDIVTSSTCPEYVCDYDYGDICDGRPVNG